MKTSKSILSLTKASTIDFISFLEQSGYLHKETSGVYNLNTLGILGLNKIENKVHKELYQNDCSQIQLSILQNQENWNKTNRHIDYGQELMSVNLRSNQVMRLSATAEEQITNIMHNYLNNRHVDNWFYQINTKYRDELRTRMGLLRSREFRMMDAYSFSRNYDDMMIYYERGKNSSINILKGFGCNVRIVSSDCGEVGGLMSEEIQVETNLSEDGWIEVGHCFALGTKYSESFNFKSASGEYVWMSCHGLGTTRLLMVLLNSIYYNGKMIGNDNFSVIDDVLVCIGNNDETKIKTQKLYNKLKENGRIVFWEDRFKRAGQLLNASETLGSRNRYIISDRIDGDFVELNIFNGETKIINII